MIRFREIVPRLPVADLGRSLAFYRDLLGFRADVLWPDDTPTFAILVRDDARLAFFTPTPERPGKPGYAEISVEATGVAALHDAVAPRWRVEWGPEVYAYGRREFAVRDPDDYLVIFTEPTEEAPTTGEPA